jgi:hypothetical protein
LKQQLLGQRGLTRVGMRNNSKSAAVERHGARFKRFRVKWNI